MVKLWCCCFLELGNDEIHGMLCLGILGGDYTCLRLDKRRKNVVLSVLELVFTLWAAWGRYAQLQQLPRAASACHTAIFNPKIPHIIWILAYKQDHLLVPLPLIFGFSFCRDHQWMANIVPVPKKDGKVRMCVDYRDLNKTSPKDDFPLPHIGMLVGNTTKFNVFFFMDGFSSYN